MRLRFMPNKESFSDCRTDDCCERRDTCVEDNGSSPAAQAPLGDERFEWTSQERFSAVAAALSSSSQLAVDQAASTYVAHQLPEPVGGLGKPYGW